MERMLVVVFDNEKKGYEGKKALGELQAEGNLTIYQEAVILKHADGTVSVKQVDDSGPANTLTGTAVGALIGVLGGPVGMALGAAGGAGIGVLYDADSLQVGEDFVEDVWKARAPNRVGGGAEVDEAGATAGDVRMEALGGTVFRRALWAVQEQVRREEIDAMKADLAELKREASTANAERKAKIEKKIEQLAGKIDAQDKKLSDKLGAFEARQKAKKAILKQNAATAGRALKNLANTPL